MPEYVYALHDFVPEHEDEISFKAGDRIEVVEKDDMYEDGWWQGRNLSGKIGLFPQSYTSATPANAAFVPDIHTPKLQPLQEESAEDVAALATPETNTSTLQSHPQVDSPSSPNNDNPTGTNANGNTVMSATLTDVQRAIEQLAARRDTDDATSRSFSFASTNHDTDTESEADHRDGDEQHQWHRDARRALAERAQMENARREREESEALRGPLPPPLLDAPAIPIAAELSDESDMEDAEDGGDDHDDDDDNRKHSQHERLETSETAHTDVTVVPQSLPSLAAPVPEPAQPTTQSILAALTLEAAAASAAVNTPVENAQETLASASITPSTSTSTYVAANIPLPKTPAATATFPTIQTPRSQSPPPPLPPLSQPAPSGQIQNLSIEAPLPFKGPMSPSTIAQTPQSAATITPFTAGNFPHPSTFPEQPSVQPPPPPSSSSLTIPSPSPLTAQMPEPQFTSSPTQLSSQPVSPSARGSSPAPPSVQSGFRQLHPSEWTVDQVVEWLKSKGMDEATCSKFIEHEITGDVLLELDGAMLKDEMGITALGKRMRIQNGIVELKRPVSANLNNLTSMPIPLPMSMQTTTMTASPSMPIMSGSVSVSSASSFGHGHGQGGGQQGTGMMMIGANGIITPAGVQQQQMYNFNGIPVPMPQPPGAVYAGTNVGQITNAQGYPYPIGNGNGNGNGRTSSVESPLTVPETGSPYAGSIVSEEFTGNGGPGGKDSSGLSKPRPAHLKFSPSDGALGNGGGAGITIDSSTPTPEDEVDGRDRDRDGEDKGVHSEPETPLHHAISSRRRRLFGLSTESGASSSLGSRKSGDRDSKTSAPATPRSGSIRIGANVLHAAGSALRSRSPTPVIGVGVGVGPGSARRSGESTGGASTTRVGDDSLVIVSGAPSPATSPSHASTLGVGGGSGSRHAKSKKSFDGSLAGVFGRDKDKEKEKDGNREKEREREKEEKKARGAGDRSSFFGNGMSLGRSRKPAPRYSIYEAEAAASAGTSLPVDKHRSISRYITSTIGFGSISGNSGSGGNTSGGGGGAGGKKKNSRPGTAPSGNGTDPVPFGGQRSKNNNASSSPSRSPVRTINIHSFGTTKDDTHLARSSSISPVSAPNASPVLRKRHVSTIGPTSSSSPAKPTSTPLNASTKADKVDFQVGLSVLDQIGQPDYAGWLKKRGEKYNAWKTRYLVLKGPHLYYLKDADRMATKIKGYVKVQGYKIVADESGPGKYGFKIVHEDEPTHYFCSDELLTAREWMKALMKATIERDYSKPVISSCNIPTIPLVVAQTMNPGPRPPSPTARDATQRALRRENPNQLSTRDARVLMGLPSPPAVPIPNDDRKSNGNGKSAADEGTYFMEQPLSPPPPLTPSAADEEATLVNLASSVSAGSGSASKNAGGVPPPKRPARDSRTPLGPRTITSNSRHSANNSVTSTDNIQASDLELVEWANSVLPSQYRISDITVDLSSGLVLFRLAESLKGRPSEPPVADSIFTGENNLDGMFKLFDFLLDNEVKMGSVSINDIKQGRRDKIVQLLKALKAWGEKRKTVAR